MDNLFKSKRQWLNSLLLRKKELEEDDSLDNKEDEQARNEEINKVLDDLFSKCKKCGTDILSKELLEHEFVCPKCNYHFRMSSNDRIALTADENSFKEIKPKLRTKNALNFPNYTQKVLKLEHDLNLNDAVVTGICKIGGNECVLGVMDTRFMMGSMGSVVGEKITRAFELATKNKLPVVMFTSSGGARMQEGMISLIQMAKTSASVKKHSEAGLLYISVMTDPTTGGVTASFASLADIILAENGALIGFAGPRVIEQTIKQSLPEGFQSAEFQLKHGFVDKVLHRSEVKETLAKLLSMHTD